MHLQRGKELHSLIDYEDFLNLLHELLYIDLDDHQKENEQQQRKLRDLAHSMWLTISYTIGRKSGPRVIDSEETTNSEMGKIQSSILEPENMRRASLSDLQLFLIAIENIQIQRPSIADKENTTPLVSAEFAERIHLYDIGQAKRIALQFKPLVTHRVQQLVEIAREKEKQMFLSINRFEPRINRKSEIIANKNLGNLELICRNVSARHNISRNNSKEKLEKFVENESLI